jgi:hypothetical protein
MDMGSILKYIYALFGSKLFRSSYGVDIILTRE